MTKNDLLHGNRDLLHHCVELLQAQAATGMAAEIRDGRLHVRTESLDLLDVTVDGHSRDAAAITDGEYVIEIKEGDVVEVSGWAQGTLAQRRRLNVS
jgi:hypothetical protein